MITINIGRPRVTLRKSTSDGEAETMEGTLLEDQKERIFTAKNVTILLGGVALGIILKQQSDIHTLKRTVNYLQEIIR